MTITKPQGFVAAGVTAGIKKSGTPDLALVVNEGPKSAAAAVFTSNRFPAAPVQWSRRAVADGSLRAVVLNSGGANACTGAEGYADAVVMAEAVSQELAVPVDEVAVCSTGLIGVRLPLGQVLSGIKDAATACTPDGGPAAARAIMTTDTVPKEAEYVSSSGWVIGGMAKGAGMLAPALATMLVVLTTDAEVSSADLDAALRQATAQTFDRTDSDGCMSTNDTVLVLASGLVSEVDSTEFVAGLTQVCDSLARQLIADAEGASHDVAIQVTQAATETDAVEVARAVARSNLFKCAIFGGDPNWGRVLSAVGTTQAAFDPEAVSVSFNQVPVFVQGAPGADRALVDLASRQVDIEISLGAGTSTATVRTNDLTYGYVKENAEYSS